MRAAALAGLLLAAWGGASAANPFRNIAVGEAAPKFSLPDPAGKERSLDEYKGSPVVLVFWRPGQEQSRRVLDAARSLAARFKENKVVLVAVAASPGEEAAAGTGEAEGFTVLLDRDREVYGRYGLFVLPTTAVLDKEHRIRAVYSSYQRSLAGLLEADLRGVLGLPPEKVREALVAPVSDPQDVAVNFAERLMKEGKPEAALAALGPAPAKPSPDRVLVVSEALIRLGRAPEARGLLEALLETAPDSEAGAKIPDSLPPAKGKAAAALYGRTLTLAREFDRAQAWLKAAVELNPNAAHAHFYLAELYEQSGRPEEALKEYKALLRRLLGPL